MKRIQKNYDDLKSTQNRVKVILGNEVIKIVNFTKKLLELSEQSEEEKEGPQLKKSKYDLSKYLEEVKQAPQE